MDTMKKTIYLTILSVITVICVIAGCGIHIMGWWGGRFLTFAGGRVSHTDKDIPAFTGISVDMEVGDLTVRPSSDGYAISYDCNEKMKPEYRVEAGVLTVTMRARKSWWQNIFTFRELKSSLTINVPYDVYMDMFTVKADVGDVNIEDVKSEVFTVEMNVGDLDVKGGTFKNVNINSDVGDVDVRNVVFDKMGIYSDVGDVDLIGVGNLDDYNIRLSTDIGNLSVNGDKVKGEYVRNGRTDKEITIETDVGDTKIKE